jgi:hypothetical protein
MISLRAGYDSLRMTDIGDAQDDIVVRKICLAQDDTGGAQDDIIALGSDWQIKPDIASRVDIALENAMSALPPEISSQEQCQQRYEALSLYLKERHKNGGSSVA